MKCKMKYIGKCKVCNKDCYEISEMSDFPNQKIIVEKRDCGFDYAGDSK